MINTVLPTIIEAFLAIALGAGVWVMAGRMGKLMLQELESDNKLEYIYNCDITDYPFDLILGPIAILLCFIIYFMNRIVQIIEWVNHKRRPKEKKKSESQWDR